MNDIYNKARNILSNILSYYEKNKKINDIIFNDEIISDIHFLVNKANSEDHEERIKGISAIFGLIVEGLNDSLLSELRKAFVRFFAEIIIIVSKQNEQFKNRLDSFGIKSVSDITNSYYSPKFILPDAPKKIIVLSRVTVGADISITSVAIQHLIEKYPNAEIVLLGSKKLEGLFGGIQNIRIRELPYSRRGGLNERLESWFLLLDAIKEENPSFVISPDSRLDQLGLLPIIQAEKYLMWENTYANDEKVIPLSQKIDKWCSSIFNTTEKAPSFSLSNEYKNFENNLSLQSNKKIIAVKLDCGGNNEKSLSKQQEIEILSNLIENDFTILLDKGFGEEEENYSDELLNELNIKPFDIEESKEKTEIPNDSKIIRFKGSIAGWSAMLLQTDGAISYDSVGQHLAAALNIPVFVIFTGFINPDFPKAWQPYGKNKIKTLILSIEEKEKETKKIINEIKTFFS